MARRNTVDKIVRLTTFLAGLRDPAVQEELVNIGFTETLGRRGWEHLQAVCVPQVHLTEQQEPVSDRRLEALVAWATVWLKIASITLEYNHPQAHALVTANLKLTKDGELVTTTSVFFRQLDEALQSDASVGEILAARGLNQAELDRGRQLVSDVQIPEPPPLFDREVERERSEAVVDDMWRFYLEWSDLARSKITDKKKLRSLGFAYDAESA